MTSAGDAVEVGAYQLLTGTAGTLGPIVGAPVFQHVPQDTWPPVVIIGDIEAEPFGAKGDPDRRCSLQIVTVTDGEARKPLLDLQAQVEARLEGARLDIDGWRLAFTFEGASATMSGDGDGYVGNSRFEVFALRL